MWAASILFASLVLSFHPLVRQSLRKLDARCKGLTPCDACAEGLLVLSQLEKAGLLDKASPNMQNKVMRLCQHDPDTVESIFSSLPEADPTSVSTILEVRMRSNDLEGAASIVVGGGVMPRPRSCAMLIQACCLNGRLDVAVSVWRVLQNKQISLDDVTYCDLLCAAANAPSGGALVLPSIAQAMVDENTVASVDALRAVQAVAERDDGEPSLAAADALEILSAKQLQRTLAIIKPDALAAGSAPAIIQRIREAGLHIVQQRRWRMGQASAAEWLRVSWGSASGGTHRRFFKELSAFYSSGDVRPLVSILADPHLALSARTGATIAVPCLRRGPCVAA